MGWWYDRFSVFATLRIRDIYNVNTFIETGTFRGVNLRFWFYHFKEVIGCEINPEYAKITQDKITEVIPQRRPTAFVHCKSSPDFLSEYIKQYRQDKRNDYVIFYLDAHFYNPKLPNKFVVLDELNSLYDFNRAIIIIHDFDVSGLGHIEYDGISLNFELVKDALNSVNPEFDYYQNTKELCAPHTLETIKVVPYLVQDEDTIETINYHNTDRLKYRGILYCLPRLYKLEKL